MVVSLSLVEVRAVGLWSIFLVGGSGGSSVQYGYSLCLRKAYSSESLNSLLKLRSVQMCQSLVFLNPGLVVHPFVVFSCVLICGVAVPRSGPGW